MSGGWLFGVCAGDDDGVVGVCGYGVGGFDELLVSGAGAGYGESGGPVFGCGVGDDRVGAAAAVELAWWLRMRSTRGRGAWWATCPGTGTGGRSRTRPGPTSGKFGKALDFNGTNARVTSRTPFAAPLEGMTLEAWVYATTVNKNGVT